MGGGPGLAASPVLRDTHASRVCHLLLITLTACVHGKCVWTNLDTDKYAA
jgi:hypothetical protein